MIPTPSLSSNVYDLPDTELEMEPPRAIIATDPGKSSVLTQHSQKVPQLEQYKNPRFTFSNLDRQQYYPTPRDPSPTGTDHC